MKKILYFVAATMALFTACTNEALWEEEHPYNKQVSITAYTPRSNSDTRMAIGGKSDEGHYTLSWTNGDKISIIRGGENKTFSKAATGVNDFTGTLPDGEGTFYAMYPAISEATDYTAVPFDISEGASGGNFPMYATSEDGQEFHFNHAMAYLQLSFIGDDLPTTGDVTVSVPYGVYTKGVINLYENGTVVPIVKGYTNDERYTRKRSVAIKNVSLSNCTAFFAIPPMQATKKTLSIKVEKNGDTYMGTLVGAGNKAIEAGHYYTATVALEKVVPEAVDLGLSVKWATFNVGATKPEEKGEYFAWGETEPKATYLWANYEHCQGTEQTLIKYCATDDITTLEVANDAATVNWGNDWRMPTKEEWNELLTECNWELCDENGVSYYKVTSETTNNSIFLPMTGYRTWINFLSSNQFYYWSSNLSSDDVEAGKCIHYESNKVEIKTLKRFNACPVRPVHVGE